MSDSDSTSPAESFELINDLNNDKEPISPSLSSLSTDPNIEEDLHEEFRMEPESKEKLDTSNITVGDLSSDKNKSSSPIAIISDNVQISHSGDNVENFDHRKFQKHLEMQIQANQEHLQSSQQPINQLQQTNLSHLNTLQFNQSISQQSHHHHQLYDTQSALPHQLNAQQMQEVNQKPYQQLNPNELANQNFSNQQQQQQSNEKAPESQTSFSNTPLPSQEIAKIASPISSSFDPSALLGWFSKQDFINKVAENAVNGFNSVLITLDPQMKEIRLAGGPNILLCSNQPFDINSVRDGFLSVFKRATVKSIDTFLSIQTAIQLVGYSTAHRISLERIKGLRSNISIVPQNQIIVSIENFLYNLDDSWFDSDYILLDDPLNKILLSCHTQGTPIEEKYVQKLKEKANHKFRDDGFSVRLDSLIASDLNCSIGEWHKEYVGFDKSQLHYQAIILLSNLYKNKLKSIGRLNE